MLHDNNENGWHEWKNHVLLELQRISETLLTMTQKVVGIETDLAALKIKAGIWGAISGLIPVVLFIIYEMIKKP
jgi:hypothetical protein